MRNDRLHKLNRIATWLIAGMAVANVGWLIAARSTLDESVFRGLQCVAMLLIMYLPHLLRSRFRIEVPSEALLLQHNAAVHIGSLGTALRCGEWYKATTYEKRA